MLDHYITLMVLDFYCLGALISQLKGLSDSIRTKKKDLYYFIKEHITLYIKKHPIVMTCSLIYSMFAIKRHFSW